MRVFYLQVFSAFFRNIYRILCSIFTNMVDDQYITILTFGSRDVELQQFHRYFSMKRGENYFKG